MYSSHMHSPMILLACALGLAAACKSDRAAGTAPDPGAVAGHVLESEGAVQARSAQGEPRRLAVGDEIRGTDLIETGPDGAVTIFLEHNNVRWAVGAQKQIQVSESKAWSLPAQPRQPLLTRTDGVDPTAAAGRQAERQAADTLATARPGTVPEEVGAEAGDKAGAEAGDKAMAEPVPAGKLDSAARSESKHRSGVPDTKRSRTRSYSSATNTGASETTKTEATARKPLMAVPGSGQVQLEAAASVESAAVPAIALGTTHLGESAGDADKSASRDAEPSASAGQPGKDAERAIRAAIEQRLPDVVKCLGSHRLGEQTLSVTFVVASSGTVSRLRAATSDTRLRGCIEKHLDSLRIPGVAAGTQVGQRLVLTLPQ